MSVRISVNGLRASDSCAPNSMRDDSIAGLGTMCFMGHVQAADLDFAFLLAGLCEIVRKLHP